MLINPPPVYRKRRARIKAKKRPPTPPAALELVAATYQDADFVELVFSRAVDASGMDPDEFALFDGVLAGAQFAPSGPPVMVNPQTVRLSLVQTDTYSGSSILLNAGAGNGIVAVDDGTPWAGVTDYEIPA